LEAKTQQNLRPKSIDTYRRYWGKFAAGFGDWFISRIERQTLQDWMACDGSAAATKRLMQVCLVVLFGFAMKQGWLVENVAAAIPLPKQDDRPPGILTVAQSEALMASCLKRDRPLCAAFALALFAGVRPSQIERMKAEQVNLDEGTARAEGWQTKSRQHRIVELPANCIAWCRQGMELPPYQWQKRFAKVRNGSGMTAKAWPKDAMRHSFASYHLALHGSADQTATLMGHSSTDMLYRHYRALVSKSDAEKFFAILPPA
jgi:integrase